MQFTQARTFGPTSFHINNRTGPHNMTIFEALQYRIIPNKRTDSSSDRRSKAKLTRLKNRSKHREPSSIRTH